jgi:hypothetical protein
MDQTRATGRLAVGHEGGVVIYAKSNTPGPQSRKATARQARFTD